jgi:hypothetical protein
LLSYGQWFETRGVAALLTIRGLRPYPEESPGFLIPRRRESAVSKDEATERENA